MAYNIGQHLAKSFIKHEYISEILEVALTSGKNCILHGPAGHGKSEMAMAAVEGAHLDKDCFIQSFGEGMDETRLFGGLDFMKLEEEKILEYNPERSFLNYRVAIFEELFDAPSIVLLSLKDTLTAKELRNGAQRFKMRTECIIALTNRSPSEISDIGPAAHAIVERFPLQLEVKWDEYDTESYISLFNKVKPRSPKFIKQMLAGTCSRACENGSFVSPRTAIHALEICCLGAKEDDNIKTFHNLRYIPEFANVMDGIQQEYESAKAYDTAANLLKQLRKNHKELWNAYEEASDSKHCIQTAKLGEQLLDEIHGVRVPESLVEVRDNLREETHNIVKESMAKAMQLV